MGKAKEQTTFILMSAAEREELTPLMTAHNIKHLLSKPILPSALFNVIMEATDPKILAETAAKEDHDWAEKHILLAEDIEINREILAALLAETKVQIDFATDGQEAIDMVLSAKGKYDLVLMDVQMPVLDGLEATKRIRALSLPAAQTLPIIAMTANAFKEDVQACLDAGMNDHIAKPIELDRLYEVLAQYLS
ncbi:MAG: response regulator [Christensenellaceae bacterium]